MTLTLNSAAAVLSEHNLLREIINGDSWQLDTAHIDGVDTPFTNLTYDTRTVAPNTLLVCKGRFRPEFLDGTEERGLAAYVAESDLSSHTTKPGLIVNDARKALSLLAAAFYDHPERDLTVIGITGTKGKTTTAYFTQSILNTYSAGRCALFSSVDNCLDGHTYAESDLTTPESLDAFRMMRQAVDNGMKYLVMEVSSQAYKVNRVYGLTFDVAAFLNISPDHISPIEHPTFEDYFHCKRQIIANSRALVLGADCDHHDLLREDAKAAGIDVTEFAMGGDAQVVTRLDPNNKEGFIATISDGERSVTLEPMALDMTGEFNIVNAAAAIAIAHRAGVPASSQAMHAVQNVQVPGRMERIRGGDNLLVYVDFAHNYISVKSLVDEIERVYGERNPRITLVSGTTGGKAIDRREGIVKGALGRVESFIFTLDDPNFEDPTDIARQMQSYVTDPAAQTQIVMPREDAVAKAIADAREHNDRFNVVLVIGKGDETRNIINGKPVPYEGDSVVVRRVLGE
ncbi:UDP-N-acetylmuramoyl-L-alanyl-D-glutamate--2,6-diaminopimelate ligase [Bifidobacterium angulatum DSM 20098 = JCM 7096]|uniref:UDP-N-acetylmuramoyl-L-alanyl-D-glutamate--2, 6-diaminopimelate ligase n=1 Tax=Bifidobacterium angulatum DSM 20098 = JCM 7096 TaxID=518635 RepID=C4FE93_9BIFI|nr:UDP-N-acetylmuramoyl-L-alanyl-D-glutamate--2,6-diaminopimelate ligase [Bifidobacterium angulatum]EEP21274.1 UDP-N-acetylmuramoyl-L-alanyl-D-glutamate--2,6-diaminopimelate ligase [Bifidobacterium angulatum DSM 20098 = JCM 7096]